MLGGLAKANIWVARPWGSESTLFLPLDMLGDLASSQHKGHHDQRTPSLTSIKPTAATSTLGQKGRQTKALGSLLTHRPLVSLHAEL
jgi:hypothetical protein